MMKLWLTALVVLLSSLPGCGGDIAGGDPGPNPGPDASVTPPPPKPEPPCYGAPPPTGRSCSCRFTDCNGTSLSCTCSPECLGKRTDCLISVDDTGKAITSDPVLSTCAKITCEIEEGAEGEHRRMECLASGCQKTNPPPPPDPPSPTTCPVPVPGPMTLTGPVWGEYDVKFYVPHASWALAAAHASKQVAEVAKEGIDLRLSPSMFFATALKESYMGCSEILPVDDPFQSGRLERRPNSYADGCLQIESTTAWVEMCRMYPGELDCTSTTHEGVVSSTNQAATGRDNFASSAFVKAYYDVFTYARLTQLGMPDPDAWFSTAADGQAMAKVVALLFNQGGWSGDAERVARQCHDKLIESCLGNTDYVVAVSSYLRELEAGVALGNCYNDLVSQEDVDDYLSRILVLFTREDGPTLRAAARSAFAAAARGEARAPFQKVAGAVLDAIDQRMKAKVHCPEAELSSWYATHCPK